MSWLNQSKSIDHLPTAAYLTLVMTAESIQGEISNLFKEHGLRASQYNVLRIAWSRRRGLTCSEINERMLVRESDTTRMVDGLVKLGAVERQRDDKDRRVVRYA